MVSCIVGETVTGVPTQGTHTRVWDENFAYRKPEKW